MSLQGLKLSLKNKYGGYLYILPAAAIYLAVIVIPTFWSVILTFYKWNGIGPKRFVGFQNYVGLVRDDPTFIHAAQNNVVWVLLTIGLTVTFALMLATLLNREFKGRGLFRGLFYFPYVLSGVVVALIWQWIYHPQLGLLTGVLDLLGLGHVFSPPLANPKTALFAVFVAELWRGFGAPMVIFLAGLQTIPRQLYEAATIDGAHAYQTFFRITIPMLRETFVIVLTTQIISAMRVYGVIFAMTAGGPQDSTHTMATYMVNQTFLWSNFGRGTTIAFIMVLVLMIVIIPFVLFMARD